MAEPRSKAEFKAYIFRRLGWPVIQVNVENEQAMDRIDDALAFYRDYHYLGSEKSLYIHTITQEDIDTGKIHLPETIMTVSNILPPVGYFDSSWMSDRYQYLRDEFYNMNHNVSYTLIPYYVAMTRLADINFLFNTTPSIRFSKITNTVEIYGAAGQQIMVLGNKIIFETEAFLDPNQYASIWQDRWLKRYATALMKRQWAENLKLYSNIPLLNGVTLDAQTMYSEAIDEIDKLEEKLISTGNFPVLDEIA
jgi:hypothetical protein